MMSARCATFTTALENGGTAVVLVPCGPKLFGTLDEVLGHCRRYTEQQLVAVGQSAGFKVERVLKFNRTGVIAWWLNGKILRRRTFGLAQIRLLNLLTPLFRVLDPWLPLPPLSLIAIFRKEDGSAPMPRPANDYALRCESQSRNARVEHWGHEIGMPRRVEETRANLFTNYKYEKILALIFVCTLPLVNPWVRGDGVGYYAFARALLIEHDLDFRQDWLHAQFQFPHGARGRSEPASCPRSSPPPAIWIIISRLARRFCGLRFCWRPTWRVKINHLFGGHIPADGFSFPYMFAMVIATALYGFLGILLSFRAGQEIFAGALGVPGHAWESGWRVRCRSICISILRGPTRSPRSRWRCSSGIGIARARTAAGRSGWSSA